MIYRIINEQVRQNCIREISEMPLECFQVDIKEIKRSNAQNRFYWRILQIIGKELGYKTDDLHEAMKRQFIGTEQGKDLFGNLYIKPKSSAKLKKAEFTEYLNKVMAFAYRENIVIPTQDYYGLNC